MKVRHQYVTYTLEDDGKFHIVEHVPAREPLETGEQYFSWRPLQKSRILSGDKASQSR